MVGRASGEAVTRRPGPAALLRTRAADTASDRAVAVRAGAGWETRTWSELYDDVNDVATAVRHAGVAAGTVAIVLLPTGIEGYVIDLALRALGVTQVRATSDARPPEIERALAGAAVSLVVTDVKDRLERLGWIDFDGASLLTVAEGDVWSRLLQRGRDLVEEGAGVLEDPDAPERDGVRAHVVADGSVLRASAPLRLDLHGPETTVLLVAEADDPLTYEVADAALAGGAGLAWIAATGDLGPALDEIRPTTAVLDHRAAPALTDLIVEARIDGSPWHKDPLAVLQAVESADGTGRWSRGAKRRASAVHELERWFGGRLTEIAADDPLPALAASACRALGFAVAEIPAERFDDVELPRRPAGPPEEAPLPVRQPGAHVDDFDGGGERATVGRVREAGPAAAGRASGSATRTSRNDSADRVDVTFRESERNTDMSNVDVALKEAVSIEGAVAALLVDYKSGMALGQAGDASALNLDVAAAGNTDVIRAKMRTMESLGLDDEIEDILITLGKAYHLIRLTKDHDGLFLYLVLDKSRANLAMARHKLAAIEKDLEI